MKYIPLTPRASANYVRRVFEMARKCFSRGLVIKLLILGSIFQCLYATVGFSQAQNLTVGIAQAQNLKRGWIEVQDANYPRKNVHEKTLTLHPALEPNPALKYRLIPSEFERGEGNAAVNYVRAMGFLEQNHARIALDDMWRKASTQSRETGRPIGDFPPYLWQNQTPDQMEVEEVKPYLQLTEFQVRDLAAARMLRDCDFNRNLRNTVNPYGILIPEVQQMRGMARDHSLRCRVAIAEGRFEDAFAILGQQYAMANHLCRDGFVVSVLVGNAIAGIAWEDALDVVQMPQSPNLYWSLATLPKPVTPVGWAFAVEKEMPFLHFKTLQEVDEIPRPTGYWVEFMDRILVEYNYLAEWTPGSALDRFALVNLIGAGYPGARHYLIETVKLDSQLVDSYPMAQVFFLAQKKYLQQAMDQQLKWSFMDYASLKSNGKYSDFERHGREHSANLGWAAIPAEVLGPAILQVRESSIRIESFIAVLQTIEAIRMYAAENKNQLPSKLADVPYPVPHDPSTGQPLQYQVEGETAVLTWSGQGIIYRLKIRLAK